ncbi:MAG: hypothetical protein FDZ70_00110 [Actinobacteria bacterium]|nr:MAG: hypothetical protein FDZ70_00110 [Actinomycetota bacterium]
MLPTAACSIRRSAAAVPSPHRAASRPCVSHSPSIRASLARYTRQEVSRMKRLSIVVLLAFALVLLYGGVAYANFGPHGGYSDDTDACAGCHRAHTSFSPLTWTDSNANSHSALLVSSASTIQEFCYACHGDTAPGASTNVESGIFDAGPSSTLGTYITNSTLNAGLNGGGFSFMATTGAAPFTPVTSVHECDEVAPGILWGDGLAADTSWTLKCTDCHDPHGSTNYRLLKDTVNGHAVGGYDTNDVPSPYVISAEENYPAGGWLLHEAGAGQMATYTPNYTAEEYAYLAPDTRGFLSMSAWCSACHERYYDKDDTTGTAVLPWDIAGATTYDYRGFESDPASGAANLGARARHRHPVNVTLAAGVGAGRSLQREVVTSTLLPLEQQPGSTNARGTWDFQDYLGCLTCHVAHGSSVTMTGWADSSLMTSPTASVTWYPELDNGRADGGLEGNGDGVNPTFDSALLRANNRGVCERCHNK